jgi:hypothetical protein
MKDKEETEDQRNNRQEQWDRATEKGDPGMG